MRSADQGDEAKMATSDGGEHETSAEGKESGRVTKGTDVEGARQGHPRALEQAEE